LIRSRQIEGREGIPAQISQGLFRKGGEVFLIYQGQ
jgi:hypothetical protein